MAGEEFVISSGREFRITEKPAFSLDTTLRGGTPASVSVTASYSDGAGGWTDATADVYPSTSTSVSGNVITMPQAVLTGQSGRVVRCCCKYTAGGSVWDDVVCVFEVMA